MIAYFQAYCLQAVYLPFCLGEKVLFCPELFFKVCGPGFALLSQALGGYFGDGGHDDDAWTFANTSERLFSVLKPI